MEDWFSPITTLSTTTTMQAWAAGEVDEMVEVLALAVGVEFLMVTRDLLMRSL